MTTHWEITTQSGYKVKIKTYSVSKNEQGMFPHVGEPNLKPIWLDLARENTTQFLNKVAEIIMTDNNLQLKK